MPQSFLPFVLLFAEPMSTKDVSAANLIFSPPIGGAIQDPNSHPIENESCNANGTTISDHTWSV